MPDEERTWELEALERYRKGLDAAPVLYRANGMKAEANPEAGMVFIASEESADRSGDIISIAGWNLENFKKNPLMLWMHNPFTPAIGTWPKVWTDGKQLLASPLWDEDDPFAKLIKGKYERNVLRAISVGFRAHEFQEIPNSDSINFIKQELLEISAVSVPSHPASLRRSMAGHPYFWIPLSLQTECIKDGIVQALKTRDIHPDPEPAMDSNASQWQEVFDELARLTEAEGGA